MTREGRENQSSANNVRLDTERAIRDSERYRAFIANSSEGIWRLEFDPPIDTSLPAEVQVDLAYRHGRYAECNQVMARMYGLEREEDLVGKTLDLMLPSSDPAARAFIKSIIEAGYRVIDVESTERDVAGNEHHFLNSMIGTVEHGHLLRMWGTQRDISEQKRNAAAQAYLAAIVESSDDAIISKDLDGVVRSCNATAERIFGYSAAELVGRPIRILIPPERQSEEDEILARIRKGERIDHFETVRLAKDGRWLDISLTVSPVRDASGAIVGVSKTARDITAEKRAAAELAAQQEWFRVTLASIGDAVIASSPDGLVTYLNVAAEALTGWPADDAQGRPLTEVFHIVNERTQQQVENPADLVIRFGHIVGLANHTMLISRDGTARSIADSAAPIRKADGAIIGVVLVFRDVTERRHAEVERQAAVVERELLLESERLARAEAERASRVKDDFVAMVSHELRTPLNAILGWTQLMLRDPNDVSVRDRALQVIARNTRVQAQLISDLLDVSRIVSGKLRLDVQRVDLAAIVADAVETVQQDAAAKGIEIRSEVDAGDSPVAGDPARLQQVVWNLLSNAIKFTPNGGHVRVTLRYDDSNAEITVADDGAGIRSDVLPHVFDRFHQADRSITRRFGGLGLGLAIVKHLVELHGGVARAESAGDGRGATFTVVLPAGVESTVEREVIPVTSQEAHEAVSLGSLRVLVVDDEPDTREFVKRLLETHGAGVLTASSAAEALSIVQHEAPDILISDIGLPDVDGYDLMQQIRQLSFRAGGGIPAIALTAYARSEDRTRALRAGYQAHLAKPVEPTELVASIASLAELIDAQRHAR